jgi:hypothetical protein
MKRDEFAGLVDGFRIRPIAPLGGQRHVYLWHGDLPALTPLLAHANVLSLDLHELIRSLERKPSDGNAARRVLEGAIAGWLRDHQSQDNQHQIVVVSGCDLLMRYQVSLAAFMQFVTDNRMFVLVAPPYREPSAPLPGYVDFKPSGAFDHLKRFFAGSCIVE